MPYLDARHARQLREALTPLYDTPPPARLLSQLANMVNNLLGAELTCFDIFNEAGQMHNLTDGSPTLFTPELTRYLADHIQEHPLFTGIIIEKANAPLKISDFCSSAKFNKLGIYHNFYRTVNVTHQLVVGMQVPGLGFATCALSRSRRDFTETERTMLAFVQPHLTQLLQQAHYRAAPPPSITVSLPSLTLREAEILRCLAQGQPDKAIAHHCGISPRTVQVHLRNIYAKLGVDNRTAAVVNYQPATI